MEARDESAAQRQRWPARRPTNRPLSKAKANRFPGVKPACRRRISCERWRIRRQSFRDRYRNRETLESVEKYREKFSIENLSKFPFLQGRADEIAPTFGLRATESR